MILSRNARRSLALVVSLALLRPEIAVAAAVNAARGTPMVSPIAAIPFAGDVRQLSVRIPAINTSIVGAATAIQLPVNGNAPAIPAAASAAAAGPSVARHPVIDALNQLQARGVSLPETAMTYKDAAGLEAAAQALPEGQVRSQLLMMAKAITASKGGTGSGQLDAAFDGSESSSKAVDNIWTKMSKWSWMPNGLSKKLAARGEKLRPKAKAGDPTALEVPIAKLRWTPAPDMLPNSTRDVAAGDKQIIGQERALKSIYFGLKMPGANYNLFVSGPDGSGRETAVRHIVGEVARVMPTPNDLVAVTNFGDPQNPLLLELPAGSANKLAAGVDAFVENYSKMLPQVLMSKQVNDMRKAVKAQWEAGVEKRQAEFDAEVAKARIGKFGIRILTEETESGMQVSVVPTYQDPKTKEMKIVESEEEFEALVEAGVFTAAEWQQAVKDAQKAGQPFQESLEAMVQENQQEAEAANEKISGINQQIALQIVNKMARTLLSSVAKNRHDTPAHKEYDKRRAQREKEFAAEVAKIRIGQYGIAFEVVENQPSVGVLKEVDGKMVPLTEEEFKAKVASGEITQDAIRAAVTPLIAKYNAMSRKNNEEHEAVHAKDEPESPEEKAASAYLVKLLQVAAGNYAVFLPSEEKEEAGKRRVDPTEMFRVSVLTTNAAKSGAPVVWDLAPTYETVFGASDDNSKSMLVPGVGVVRTNTPGGPSYKSGSFVRANGGFLIMNVMDVVTQPGLWPALMRAVRTGKAEITEGGLKGLMRGEDKRQIDAKVKVVLLGSPTLKMMLAHYDEDFGRAFNAAAEFEPTLPIGKEAIDGYLHFMASVIANPVNDIFHHTRDAIAAIMEYAARVVDSNEKMTAQFGAMFSLMKEATFWAREAKRTEVKREDIDAALSARSDSQDVYVRRMMDAYKNGVMKVETSGTAVGQVNGLAVMGSFGVPMRITVVTGVGQPGIISVDRNAGSTGQSFNKALGVVEGYLMHTFGQKRPVSAKISISFEQNYGGIDGDSATSTEIYAILSSLSGVPIQQRFAMTGSSDQFGNVQAIGGANEKTEGFFTVAANMVNKAYKDGMNAVLVPYDNVGDLMLRPDVVQAVREGKFKIYQIKTIKEGMELLTGRPFEEILQKAEARLNELRAAARN